MGRIRNRVYNTPHWNISPTKFILTTTYTQARPFVSLDQDHIEKIQQKKILNIIEDIYLNYKTNVWLYLPKNIIFLKKILAYVFSDRTHNETRVTRLVSCMILN